MMPEIKPQLLIVHIIIDLNVGGAELMLKRLIESSLSSSQYKHLVISLASTGKIGELLIDSGVEVKALGLNSAFGVPCALWRLVLELKRLRPNIVQTWMYHADLLGGLAARAAGCRNVIWGIRSTDIGAGGSRATLVVRRLCAWLSYLIPDTIVCAAETSRQVHIALGYDAKRMQVVPNGFDLSVLISTMEQRQVFRQSCGFLADDLVIGSLGRYSKVKDQENFVKAAGILAQQYSYVRFMMVGRDLDDNNVELNRYIAETGFENRFTLLGERTDVPVCLSAMDVFCLHSRTEGFPNVLGEAMSMGLPCVTTDVGDASLLLGNSDFVVPKEDPVRLAKGIEKLLILSSAERHSIGQIAKKRIQDTFTLKRTCDRFDDVYRSLLNKEIS